MRDPSVVVIGLARVSIRARPRGRAMPTKLSIANPDPDKFQSAPGLEAGRCIAGLWLPAINNLFQSAPGLEAGRCLAPVCRTTPMCMFQSAPGLEAGRCVAPYLD